MRILGLDIRRAADPAIAKEEAPLRGRVQRLEIAFGELVEHFTQLQGAHAKLRNQFHGSSGGRPAASALDKAPPGDKAALRRALGVVPGTRFAHKE